MCFGVTRSPGQQTAEGRVKLTPEERLKKLDELFEANGAAALSGEVLQQVQKEIEAIQVQITNQRHLILSVPLSQKRISRLNELSALERKNFDFRKISDVSKRSAGQAS